MAWTAWISCCLDRQENHITSPADLPTSCEPGQLLLLVGTSCAGKTTLAKALQACLPDQHLVLGLDTIFAMVSERWGGHGSLAHEGFRYARHGEQLQIVAGPVGRQVLAGAAASVKAMLDAGNHVIYDEMLLDAFAWELWRPLLERPSTLAIRLDAPIATLEAREEIRREPHFRGLASGHLAANRVETDLALDADALDQDAMASAVLQHLKRRAAARSQEI